MATLINDNEWFYLESCCSCGVRFMIPLDLRNNLKECKNTFYCPNGHSMSYRKSTAEILQEKLDHVNKELENTYSLVSSAQKRADKAERAIKKMQKANT